MGLLILEYGGILRSVMCALLILGLVFSGFIHKWQEIGGVSDSRKTHFLTDEEKRTPPVLTARDFKIREGEPLNIQSHVLSVDFDGSDISDLIQMECRREKQGILRVSLSVSSPVTGKIVRGSLVVLVDCPNEGSEITCE